MADNTEEEKTELIAGDGEYTPKEVLTDETDVKSVEVEGEEEMDLT